MENESEKSGARKVAGILINVVLYVFLAACIIVLIMSLTAKKDKSGAVNMFGVQMYVVVSPSMEKCGSTDVSAYEIKDIPVRSMVFVQPVPEEEEKAREWYSSLAVGDVLTFRYVYSSQETITHRITAIEDNGRGGYIISLAGDNKNDETGVLTQTIDTSETNSPNYVIGKVTGKSLVLGFIVYSLRQPLGLVLIIIIPCAVIIMAQIVRIIVAVNSDKKRKEARLREEQSDEIELLKKKIAELQGDKAAEDSAVPGENDEDKE